MAKKEETKKEETKTEEKLSADIPLTEEEDEDDGEWITPENVDQYKAAEIGVTPEELKQAETMKSLLVDIELKRSEIQ
ncbi:hypothetical protein G6F57_022629 [Rhizopus arrhizus]|nr:hypothetical protein G6F57_022629 [Rhizopus arrhizus]